MPGTLKISFPSSIFLARFFIHRTFPPLLLSIHLSPSSFPNILLHHGCCCSPLACISSRLCSTAGRPCLAPRLRCLHSLPPQGTCPGAEAKFRRNQVLSVGPPHLCLSQKYNVVSQRRLNAFLLQRRQRLWDIAVVCDSGRSNQGRSSITYNTGDKVCRKAIRKSGKKEHHLWIRKDSNGSGRKALNLVETISSLPNEKQAVYGALDKWIAWETEFPLVAAAKALRILRKANQWKRVIQVSKWMLSKGQGATMATYDGLLLAFDMEKRVDEAEILWNMILHAHNRSISKWLFSRMISLYDHNNMPNKVIEVFADMEELGVKPDEDTVQRVARAFEELGQVDKHKLFMAKYRSKRKYIHFKGERVRVKM